MDNAQKHSSCVPLPSFTLTVLMALIFWYPYIMYQIGCISAWVVVAPLLGYLVEYEVLVMLCPIIALLAIIQPWPCSSPINLVSDFSTGLFLTKTPSEESSKSPGPGPPPPTPAPDIESAPDTQQMKRDAGTTAAAMGIGVGGFSIADTAGAIMSGVG